MRIVGSMERYFTRASAWPSCKPGTAVSFSCRSPGASMPFGRECRTSWRLTAVMANLVRRPSCPKKRIPPSARNDPRGGLEGDIFVGDFRGASRAATVTFFGRSGLLEVVARAWRASAHRASSGSGSGGIGAASQHAEIVGRPRRCRRCRIGAASQHAEIVGDNLETGALLTFLVLPLAGLNAPFDEDQGTLLQILLRDFRLLAPDDYFVPFGALLPFAVAVFVGFVGGHGEIGDGLTAAGVTRFGIAAQAADQDHEGDRHGTHLKRQR